MVGNKWCGLLKLALLLESLSSQQSEPSELEIVCRESAKSNEEGDAKRVMGGNTKVRRENPCLEHLRNDVEEMPVKEAAPLDREWSKKDFVETGTKTLMETGRVEHPRKDLIENGTNTAEERCPRRDLTIASDNHLYNVLVFMIFLICMQIVSKFLQLFVPLLYLSHILCFFCCCGSCINCSLSKIITIAILQKVIHKTSKGFQKLQPVQC